MVFYSPGWLTKQQISGSGNLVCTTEQMGTVVGRAAYFNWYFVSLLTGYLIETSISSNINIKIRPFLLE